PTTVAATTTTSTTGPPTTSSTSTTTASVPSTSPTTTVPPRCDEVGFFGPALCELAHLSSTGICAPDPLDPRLQKFIASNVATARVLLQRAELAAIKGRVGRASRLAKAAAGRLSGISRRVARAAKEKRHRPAQISAACRQAL